MSKPRKRTNKTKEQLVDEQNTKRKELEYERIQAMVSMFYSKMHTISEVIRNIEGVEGLENESKQLKEVLPIFITMVHNMEKRNYGAVTTEDLENNTITTADGEDGGRGDDTADAEGPVDTGGANEEGDIQSS